MDLSSSLYLKYINNTQAKKYFQFDLQGKSTINIYAKACECFYYCDLQHIN